jgi:hypothetical protein
LVFLLVPILFPPKEGLTGGLGIFAMGVIFGALGGYGVSALDLILPAEVHVTSRGISRIDSFLIAAVPLLAGAGYRLVDWTWEQISSGTLENPDDSRLKYVLAVFDQNDAIIGRIGIPKSVDTEKLRTLFEHGQAKLTATEKTA